MTCIQEVVDLSHGQLVLLHQLDHWLNEVFIELALHGFSAAVIKGFAHVSISRFGHRAAFTLNQTLGIFQSAEFVLSLGDKPIPSRH